jgi:hypothetical protein
MVIGRWHMRIILFLFIATATSALAFVVPGGEPTTTIVGRVISMEKLGDYGRDKIIHWELWKARAKVEPVTGSDTNIAETVSVYYAQDWSTNSVDIAGMHVGRPPLRRLATNEVYRFTCHHHANITREYGLGAETNGLLALVGMIVPK